MKLPEIIYEEIVSHLKKGEVYIHGLGTFKETIYGKKLPTWKNGRVQFMRKATIHMISFSPHDGLKARLADG